MGLYDSVLVPCPKCDSNVEFQTKSGECAMFEFPIELAPPELRADIIGDEQTCSKCRAVVRIRGHVSAWPEIKNG